MSSPVTNLMQLDIFNDSRDVMLRNDLLHALQKQNVPKAQAAWVALQQAYPNDPVLARAQVLLDALHSRAEQASTSAPQLAPFANHTALQQERLILQHQLAPLAQSVLGQAASEPWLRPFWQALATRAVSLPFDASHEADHAVPLLLHQQDWQGVMDAVVRIASWRHIPAPLAWMAQAKLQLLGLPASWPLLAELAWLSPKRLEAIVQSARDPLLQRLKEQFDASFEPGSDSVDAAQDLAWFPAWVLTHQPKEVAHVSQAQPGQHTPPEQAMRLLVNLLGLERQGRQHDIVTHRKSLRDLNGWLYAQYLKTR